MKKYSFFMYKDFTKMYVYLPKYKNDKYTQKFPKSLFNSGRAYHAKL